jgi:hypothetical protein
MAEGTIERILCVARRSRASAEPVPAQSDAQLLEAPAALQSITGLSVGSDYLVFHLLEGVAEDLRVVETWINGLAAGGERRVLLQEPSEFRWFSGWLIGHSPLPQLDQCLESLFSAAIPDRSALCSIVMGIADLVRELNTPAPTEFGAPEVFANASRSVQAA